MTLPSQPPFLAECRRVGPILSHIGDKWSMLVVMLLGDGPRRFNDIKRSVDGISQRMLTLTLKGLERDGMVTRTMFPTIPPRVEYELTELGHASREPIRVLVEWILTHLPAIQTAQAKFDLRKLAESK
jgi:DNA-binding HxlR family transcriptional regulator